MQGPSVQEMCLVVQKIVPWEELNATTQHLNECVLAYEEAIRGLQDVGEVVLGSGGDAIMGEGDEQREVEKEPRDNVGCQTIYGEKVLDLQQIYCTQS